MVWRKGGSGRPYYFLGRSILFVSLVAFATISRNMNRAIFLDRDGTIIQEKEYLRDTAQVEVFPEAFTGLKEKSSLVREALKALIERESARRLARLGGSERGLRAPPRRRSSAT